MARTSRVLCTLRVASREDGEERLGWRGGQMTGGRQAERNILRQGDFSVSTFCPAVGPQGLPPRPLRATPYYFVDMNEKRKPYPFDQIEPKWQTLWTDGENLPHAQPRRRGLRSGQAEVLRARHVPLPQRLGPARRASGGLHGDGHHRALPADAGFQRPAPDGLGRLRPARRTARHQDRRASARKHGAQHRQLQAAAQPASASTTTGTARSTRPTRVTSNGRSGFSGCCTKSWFNPATNKAEPISTYPGGDPDSVRLAFVSEAPGELVPGAGHRAGQRGGRRRQERGRRLPRRAPPDAPVDAAHHRVCRTAHQRTGRPRLARVHQAAAAQLDRPQRGGARHFMLENFENRPTSLVALALDTDKADHPAQDAVPEGPPRPPDGRADRVHHAARHALRRDVHGALARASAGGPIRRRRAQGRHRQLPRGHRREVGPGAHRTRQGENGRVHRRVRGQSGQRRAHPRVDRRLRADGLRHRARSWPCPRTTNATGSLRRNSICLSGRSCSHGQDGKRSQERMVALRRRWRSRDQFENRRFVSSTACRPPRRKPKIIAWLEGTGSGQRKINYKLRDWLFSRQRYWGEPFPIIWHDGKHSVLPESELPLLPPDLDDFKPTGTGEPPLAKATDWVRYSDTAMRETNTMPQWAGSCWYYLRFCDPRNARAFRRRGGRAVLDGRRQAGRRRPVRRRHRARRVAPALRAVLAQGALRPRLRLHARAVPAAGQPGAHSRRGRTKNVQEPRQRGQSRRGHHRIRRGRVAALRDVHGSAGTDQAVEHGRRAGRGAVPGARVASGHGGRSGRPAGA